MVLIAKQVIPLVVAAMFFVSTVYPKPILVKALRERHPHELIARLCLFSLGLLAVWGWYRINRGVR
jgi:hypothetical protein